MFIKVTPTSGPFMVNVDAIETINSTGGRSVICFRRDAEYAYLNVEETVDQIMEMINSKSDTGLLNDILHYLENQSAYGYSHVHGLKERLRAHCNTTTA